MDRARWEQIEDLFREGLEQPLDARTSWLRDRAGGDEALRDEVAALLSHHARASGFLAEPLTPSPRAGGGPAARGHRPEVAGYELLDRLGEGGMGEVFLAERRDHPVGQRVALKVVKRGMDSCDVLRRFEGERRALSLLAHPNIARIQDGGETSDGRPWFAMELVPGAPITKFCDDRRLALRARIELFLDVCDGVRHAHGRGIVHRDLKPNNVLVVDVDGRPVVKIIDFGLAKALRRRLTERTLCTVPGLALGTPEYMSPEQAAWGEVDIDARTDVYSLGVLLYEMLSGALPVDAARLRESSYLEALRIIREEEAPAPSTRVHAGGAAADHAAGQRGVTAAALARALRSDLDAIVMKALAKDRDRRFGTVAALADDLGRHLAGEPVEAALPGSLARLRKTVVRHRRLAAALLVVFVALAAGLALALVGRRRAESAERELATRYDELVRLSDARVLAELEREAERLWPERPAKAAAMQAWIERAESVLENLPRHRASLERLAGEGVPGPREAASGSVDRKELEAERAVFAQRLEALRARDARSALDRAEKDVLERLRHAVSEIDGEIARARERRRSSLPLRFPTAELAWRHEVLTTLVSGLERLEATLLPDVRGRRSFASTIAERTVHAAAAAAAWEEAIDDIEERRLYRGLDLEPQIGLLPLGRNPQSGLWEFWHVRTGDRPRPTSDGPAGSWALTADTGLVLVLIPGGRFAMGADPPDVLAPPSANRDPMATSEERPTHDVTLAPYFISKYEMTQGQWLRITGSNPSRFRADATSRSIGGRRVNLLHPVEGVSWEDTDRLLFRIGLDLPTEAQWERAARGGTSTPWWTGETRESLRGHANLGDLDARDQGTRAASLEPGFRDSYPGHSPAGRFGPNPFGLYEVLGNVTEWCRDGFGPYAFRPPRPGDGEHRFPRAREKSIRGGNYLNDGTYARSAFRGAKLANARSYTIGLRPARRVTAAGAEDG